MDGEHDGTAEPTRRRVGRRAFLASVATTAGLAGCAGLDGDSTADDAGDGTGRSGQPTTDGREPTASGRTETRTRTMGETDAAFGRSWRPTWREEFDGDALDTSVWTHELGNGHEAGIPGWGNEEPQYYQRDNARVENGRLVIEAREEHVEDAYGEYDYTASRLKTQDSLTRRYGRVDVRARLPRGQGIWPAAWALGSDISSAGWPDCGEIDVMEYLGHEPATVHGTVHGPGYAGADGVSGSHSVAAGSFADSFHTFSLVWEPDRIEWYVDETRYHTVTRAEVEASGNEWVFDGEFFLLLNVACGGEWPGYPDETTAFPQQMAVEYVRHYEQV